MTPSGSPQQLKATINVDRVTKTLPNAPGEWLQSLAPRAPSTPLDIITVITLENPNKVNTFENVGRATKATLKHRTREAVIELEKMKDENDTLKQKLHEASTLEVDDENTIYYQSIDQASSKHHNWK